jgi:hypothetical protein
MKTAVLWGTVFGILQAIITLIVSIYFSSPSVATLACVGLLLSFALTVACSLIGAIQAKAFNIGFWAGIIATGFDVIAGLFGYVINPTLREVGVVTSVISFAISIGFGVVLSAVGAGIGYLIYSKFMNPAQIKS